MKMVKRIIKLGNPKNGTSFAVILPHVWVKDNKLEEDYSYISLDVKEDKIIITVLPKENDNKGILRWVEDDKVMENGERKEVPSVL